MKEIRESAVNCWVAVLTQSVHWIRHASTESVTTLAKNKQFVLKTNYARFISTVRSVPARHRSSRILSEDAYCKMIVAGRTVNVHHRRHVSKASVSIRAM